MDEKKMEAVRIIITAICIIIVLVTIKLSMTLN